MTPRFLTNPEYMLREPPRFKEGERALQRATLGGEPTRSPLVFLWCRTAAAAVVHRAIVL